jgi:hypothetical protein
MRVLVCGGREFSNWKLFQNWMTARLAGPYYTWKSDPEPNGTWSWDLTIIHGGANGADTFAGLWANLNYVDCTIFLADWEKYGKRAGYLRNVQMLEEGKPDLVIAFPGGRGTQMMINLAKGAGVPVEIVEYASNV